VWATRTERLVIFGGVSVVGAFWEAVAAARESRSGGGQRPSGVGAALVVLAAAVVARSGRSRRGDDMSRARLSGRSGVRAIDRRFAKRQGREREEGLKLFVCAFVLFFSGARNAHVRAREKR
jgi:hypothetical protein